MGWDDLPVYSVFPINSDNRDYAISQYSVNIIEYYVNLITYEYKYFMLIFNRVYKAWVLPITVFYAFSIGVKLKKWYSIRAIYGNFTIKYLNPIYHKVYMLL